jgi:hypothetical protein
MTEVCVFPDTNVFLHWPLFDQLDWPSIVADVPVRLVVSRIVVAELDRHKNENKNRTLRERAATALARIESIAEGGGQVRAGVCLETLRAYADRSSAPTDLDLDRPDDNHIATALEFQKIRGVSVRIVTGDTGMRLATRAYGLEALVPPGDRLPAVPDEAETQLRKAQTELAQLQSKLPKLVLTFGDGAKVLPVRARAHQKPSDSALELIAGRELAKLQVGGKTVTAEYQRMLRRFIDDTQEHLRLLSITIAVQLVLCNRGDGPADDIHVRVTWPEWIEVTDKPLIQPVQPVPGDEHRHIMRALMSLPEISIPSSVDLEPAWIIDKRTAEFTIDRVLQKREFLFPKVFMRSRNGSLPKPFGLQAHVVVGEPAHDHEFNLGIKIEGDQ